MKSLLFLLALTISLMVRGQDNPSPQYNFTYKVGIGVLKGQINPPGAHVVIGDSATTKGLIIPRVVDTNAITLPRQGMIIYSLSDQTFYYRTLTRWKASGIGSGSFSFETTKPYRAWQGIAVSAMGIYVFSDRDSLFNLSNTIQIYDSNGIFQRELTNAYTVPDANGFFMSFGSANFDTDTTFLVTAYNYNSGGPVSESRVLRFSATTLTVKNTYPIGGNVAEGVVKVGNEYFVAYHDQMVVKKFDANFTFLQTYTLSRPTGPYGGYQNILFVGNDVYFNYHGPNSYGLTYSPGVDHYTFNGTTFTYIDNTPSPTYGAGQGFSLYNGKYYWADRPGNSIIVTNSLTGLMTTYTNPNLNNITTNNITSYAFGAKPLNIWGNSYLAFGYGSSMTERMRIDNVAVKIGIPNSNSSTALLQIHKAGITPYLAVGQFLSNQIYQTLRSDDTATVANANSTMPIRGFQMNRYVTLSENGISVNTAGAYSGMLLRGYDSAFLNNGSFHNVTANLDQLWFTNSTIWTGIRKFQSGISEWDAAAATISSVQTNGSTGPSHFRLRGSYASHISAIRMATFDSLDRHAFYMIDGLTSGRVFKSYGLISPLTITADTSWFLYNVNLDPSYTAGTFQIGSNNIANTVYTQLPNASAMLEINSTSKGILPPRMTTAQRNAITSPAEGLVVYDTDLHKLYDFNGTIWEAMGGGGGTGTVTNFSAGDLSPLFTTTETNTTTTPALTFNISNTSNNTYFGNVSGSTAAPIFNTFKANYIENSEVRTTSGAYTVTTGVIISYINPPSVLGTLTITMPASPQDKQRIQYLYGGTIAAGSPVVASLTISANTGQSLYQSITPTAASGGDMMEYEYDLTNTTWRRLK